MASPVSFAARVIAWQKVHGRHDLPWQQSREPSVNPYRIWLSEIMLQQTQVATVIPYFKRFVERFSDVHALAAAPVDAVMSIWAGLGYYTRARNLHRCAQQIVEQHSGKFPRSADSLAQLPGIGRSTAAAIAALAYGERAAILEGNVKRVLARHFGIEGYPGSAHVQRSLWQLAERLLPAKNVETYTQGLMDLGAMICVRARPLCAVCPVGTTCVARRDQKTNLLPAARPVKQRPIRSAIVLLLRDDDGAFLLEQRPPSGIWGGLLSLPEFDVQSQKTLVAEVQSRYGLHIRLVETLAAIRHEFTHYTFVMQPRSAQVIGTPAASDALLRPLMPDELEAAPLPSPIRRLLQQVAQPALL